MSGQENLFHCGIYGILLILSVENALEMLHLSDAADKPVKSYSLGMKQRLGIARAVLCKPELLILMSRRTGWTPAGMKQIRDLMKMLCAGLRNYHYDFFPWYSFRGGKHCPIQSA